jgi:hypothetical protein
MRKRKTRSSSSSLDENAAAEAAEANDKKSEQEALRSFMGGPSCPDSFSEGFSDAVMYMRLLVKKTLVMLECRKEKGYELDDLWNYLFGDSSSSSSRSPIEFCKNILSSSHINPVRDFLCAEFGKKMGSIRMLSSFSVKKASTNTWTLVFYPEQSNRNVSRNQVQLCFRVIESVMAAGHIVDEVIFVSTSLFPKEINQIFSSVSSNSCFKCQKLTDAEIISPTHLFKYGVSPRCLSESETAAFFLENPNVTSQIMIHIPHTDRTFSYFGFPKWRVVEVTRPAVSTDTCLKTELSYICTC